MATTTSITTSSPRAAIPSKAPEQSNTENEPYFSSLVQENVEPLWNVLHKMVPPRPNPLAASTLWSYSSLRPLLLRAGDIVSAEEAERRVLMLVNPNLSAPFTTDTIYAGLQLVLPGETAPAHRHTAFALRFVIEGSRGFTAVEGQKIPMERGDVVLTPSWHWHDHGNEGEGPMIWLDGLDLPVFTFLRNNFAENYSESRYPSTPVETSPFRIPWKGVQEVLDGEEGGHAVYHYRFENGEFLSKTISAQAERVRQGETSRESWDTCSFVYHVYEGEGFTVVKGRDGKEERISWKKGDTFSVPSWHGVSHTCDGDGNAYLFAVNDRPMVESLGMAKKA